MRGIFITGTDTGVGKTRVSTALLHPPGVGWRQAAGLKPVAAGMAWIAGRQVNEDVHLLRAASSLPLTDAEVSPYQFDTACAPHIAAALEGRTVDRGAVLESIRAMARRADWLVVEGVGGFCVPLGDDWSSADLAADLGLPVLLVVGLRLGCLNHAQLTAQAVRARGLRLVGWVGNRLTHDLPHADANLAALSRWLAPAPCLGVVPYFDDPTAAAVAMHLDLGALRAALALPEADRAAAPLSEPNQVALAWFEPNQAEVPLPDTIPSATPLHPLSAPPAPPGSPQATSARPDPTPAALAWPDHLNTEPRTP